MTLQLSKPLGNFWAMYFAKIMQNEKFVFYILVTIVY